MAGVEPRETSRLEIREPTCWAERETNLQENFSQSDSVRLSIFNS